MKFGLEVGFGPKPAPDNFFWILTPKMGSFWGRKGQKIWDFYYTFLDVKKVRGDLENNFDDKKVSNFAQECPQEISLGYVKRWPRGVLKHPIHLLLLKVFYIWE